MKGLEALKDLQEIKAKTIYILDLQLDIKVLNDFSIIEKELKVLDIILKNVPLNIIRSYLEKEEKGLLKEISC